ncbi:MAG: DUF3365 domain-containing protein [Desulfocapsaceae bacterium]|jgi:signal transduction histidine kinase|nr:DUF3365 domain-containing protein [Desulfocapsaceae bacterium]
MKLQYKFIIIIGLILACSYSIIFLYISNLQYDLVIGQANQQAKMMHRQLLLTREWISDHQGLFVVKTEQALENPYLDQQSIHTDRGLTLVKRNPAMVTRELSEYAEKAGYGWFRVTSLDPINPANSPDPFEKSSLERFQDKDIEELTKIIRQDGEKRLRYIAPLKVKSSCLSCHAEHGYKIDDIRGALSISIPIEWADHIIAGNNRTIIMIGLLSILTVIGLLSYLFNTFVARPLTSLKQAMDNYPDTPYQEIDFPDKADELGILASRFSALCQRLESSHYALGKAQEQAFYSEKMAALGQITAGIAHEINNPLGGMLNCVKNMEDEPDNLAMHTRYLPLLRKGLRRIETIMSQLLNFGRNAPLQLRKVSIDDEIRECFSLLAYRMKDITLELDLNLEQPYCIDTEAIKQIVVNIGLNAIQALPEGGTITVHSFLKDDLVNIVIRDSGPGIADDVIDSVFDPFFTTKEVGQGTGLGLAVTYSLVQKMEGSIFVESLKNSGCSFTVLIPVSQSCSEALIAENRC